MHFARGRSKGRLFVIIKATLHGRKTEAQINPWGC